MVTDVFGRAAAVGDVVAFAAGGKGASKWFGGTVTNIGPATVEIEYTEFNRWQQKPYTTTVRRRAGCFAVRA